jgi:hypothetical protein
MSVSWLKAQCETQEEILSGCLVFFADSITRCNCVEPCKLTSWDWIPLALSMPRHSSCGRPLALWTQSRRDFGWSFGRDVKRFWKMEFIYGLRCSFH